MQHLDPDLHMAPSFPYLVHDVNTVEASGRLSTDLTQNTSGPWLRKYLGRGIHPISSSNKSLKNFLLTFSIKNS